MRILVIGKNGQVANALFRVIQPLPDFTCICLGRPELDITDVSSISNALDHVAPELVINASAYTAVDKAETEREAAFQVNAFGAELLAKLTAERDLPLLHISTDYVFSGDKTGPYLEEDETGPTGIYGESKLAGEKLVRSCNPKHIIMRTSWVYDRTGSNFPKTMLRLADTRNEISVVSDQIGNPTDAEEIANALMSLTRSLLQKPDNPIYGTYHFAGPQTLNWADFARIILRTSSQLGGPHAMVRDITTADYPTPAKRPANSSLNCEKFKKACGYNSISVEASIERHMSFWLQSLV